MVTYLFYISLGDKKQDLNHILSNRQQLLTGAINRAGPCPGGTTNCQKNK